MANTMDKLRELGERMVARSQHCENTKDGIAMQEHAAELSAILRESEAQVPVAATLDEAAADPALALDVARELLRDAAAGIRSLAASATSDPDADLELIWHSVSDNAETNAAYRRLKARLAALKAEKPTADEVLIAVKRDEGYEDVHPELVAEDFVSNPSAWCYRVLTPAVCAQMTSATPPAGDAKPVAFRAINRDGSKGEWHDTATEAETLQKWISTEWQIEYAYAAPPAGDGARVTLAAKWRQRADQIEPSPECPGVVAERAAARAEALRDCADELEAALAAREGGRRE